MNQIDKLFDIPTNNSNTELLKNNGICGLQNMGNTCYINSVIQCIRYDAYLFEYYKGNYHKRHLNLTSEIDVAFTNAWRQLLMDFWRPVFMTVPILIVSLAQFGLDPWVLVILFSFAVLQFIDGNIFLPFLMSGVVKLPAVIVLMSVFFFGALFGIWGVFFSVPLASFFKSLMDNWKLIDS